MEDNYGQGDFDIRDKSTWRMFKQKDIDDAVIQEREACAKIADEVATNAAQGQGQYSLGSKHRAEFIAQQIRARGTKGGE